MKVLIFGGSGGLGSKITKKFKVGKINVKSLSSKDCDISIDEKGIDELIYKHDPRCNN